MNINLNKYLQEVFRKEVKNPVVSHPNEIQFEYRNYSDDPRKNRFVLDNKFSHRLDEII